MRKEFKKMKSIANRLFLFAAAALSLGTAAYGQNTLKADVPFAFRMPGGVASAGQYTIRLDGVSNGQVVHINNWETGHSALSVGYSLYRNVNVPIVPRLVFRCGETGCALSEIWTPTGGYGVPVRHVRSPEYIASIPLAYSQN
jgi:hypothetical protein